MSTPLHSHASDSIASTADTGMVVLVIGNPVDGFKFIGPVKPNTDICEDITDRVLGGAEWWLAPLVSAEQALAEYDQLQLS